MAKYIVTVQFSASKVVEVEAEDISGATKAAEDIIQRMPIDLRNVRFQDFDVEEDFI